MRELLCRNSVSMQTDASPLRVMALDLLASGGRKLFTESPPLVPIAGIMLSHKSCASPFLCLASLDSVYTRTSTWSPILSQPHNKPDLGEVTGGRTPAALFAKNVHIPRAHDLNPPEQEPNLQQLDLMKCRRMDGRHPAVPVRDAVCFSLRLIELLMISLGASSDISKQQSCYT